MLPLVDIKLSMIKCGARGLRINNLVVNVVLVLLCSMPLEFN